MRATVGSQIIGNIGLLAITVGCWWIAPAVGMIVGGLLCVVTSIFLIKAATESKGGAASDSDTS